MMRLQSLAARALLATLALGLLWPGAAPAQASGAKGQSTPVPSAQSQSEPLPVEMPSPIPTPTPGGTPVPYPAYGTPAPDVEQLTPHAGVPAVVTLEQAEKIAVALSPVFASQNAQWAAIHAKFTSSEQALLPGVSASGEVQQQFNPSQTVTIGGKQFTQGGQELTEGATITVQQLIYDGGRTIASIRSAKQADIAGRATLVRDLETLQLDVANAYYAVLEDNATVVADVQLVREFETNEDSVRAQIRNGAAARSDLAGAQFQTAQARGQLVTAQGAAIAAQAAFATTLGLDADTQVVPKQIGEESPQTNPTYAESLKRAFILRPDYLASIYNVYSAQEGLRYAKLARFPVLSGSGAYTTSRAVPREAGLAPPIENFLPSQTLGMAISVPIYDQGVTNYNVANAASQLDQARASQIQTKLQVESDVRSALANLISARANLIQARAEQRAAQVSLDATQAQYKVGATTILNLVTAEANLSTAAASYIAALYGVRTAEQNYLYATGASDLQL